MISTLPMSLIPEPSQLEPPQRKKRVASAKEDVVAVEMEEPDESTGTLAVVDGDDEAQNASSAHGDVNTEDGVSDPPAGESETQLKEGLLELEGNDEEESVADTTDECGPEEEEVVVSLESHIDTNMSIAELRRECTKRNLSTSGRKRDLVDRLRQTPA